MRQSGGAIDGCSRMRYKDRTGEEVILKELSYPPVSRWLARTYGRFGAWISIYYEPGSDTLLSHLLYVSVWICYVQSLHGFICRLLFMCFTSL